MIACDIQCSPELLLHSLSLQSYHAAGYSWIKSANRDSSRSCNWHGPPRPLQLAAPTRLSRSRREDCYVAVRRASIHTEAICITGPALPCPYTQTKGHYLRTMPLVWHNERFSESHSKPLWNRNDVASWPYGQPVPAPAQCCTLFAETRGKSQW